MAEQIALNCDCMEYMKSLPDKYFDLAICDPPYGMNIFKNGGGDCSARVGGGSVTGNGVAEPQLYHTFSDEKPPDKEYFGELFRVSENQIIFGANHFISRIPYDSHCWIVWDKQNGTTGFADCELAWTSFNTAVRKFEFMWNGMLQGDMRNKEARIHPTQKPVALYKWILRNYAKEGDRIFDSHLGSGSSRIAAYDMDFDFVGCEIDEYYFEKQEERFQEHTAQLRLI